jgi:hypothetical protein
MSGEEVRIWKEALSIPQHSGICLDKLRRTAEIQSNQKKIAMDRLPGASSCSELASEET